LFTKQQKSDFRIANKPNRKQLYFFVPDTLTSESFSRKVTLAKDTVMSNAATAPPVLLYSNQEQMREKEETGAQTSVS
jgi:hypothetical protein